MSTLTILRTDTVFAKLPIHTLTKSVPIHIHISQTNAQGVQELYWSVSPSSVYGAPQLLAYKIDTLVINRHLDALKRPLPPTICLGSLRQIYQDLGQSKGKSTGILKRAFHQNAGVYITAKLRYCDLKGKQRRLEAGFNRYGIVFTGESLPDGRTADAVYVILHESYRQVLNSAPTRPIDYDYLTDLKPLAQRFYELLSFKMFATLKYQHPEVSMRYSEFCLYAPQQRHRDGARMSKQMHKVHQPHLASGYLAEVSTERVKDEAGGQDWILHYTPGPKARAEYQAFTGPHRKGRPSLPVTAGEDEPGERLSDGSEAGSVARLQTAIRTAPAITARASGGPDWRVAAGTDEPAASLCDKAGIDAHHASAAARQADPAAALVQQFHRQCHGLSHYTPHPKEIEHARRLIEQYGVSFAAFFLAFASKRVRQSGFKPDVFGGLMRYEASALAAYQSQGARDAKAQREVTAQQQRCLLDAYDAWLRQRLAGLKDALSAEQLQALREEARQRVGATPAVPHFARACQVAYEVETQLMETHGLPSFEVWRQAYEQPHTVPSEKGNLR